MASTESVAIDELEFCVWHSHAFTKSVWKSNQNSSRKMWAFGKKQVGVKIVNSSFYFILFFNRNTWLLFRRSQRSKSPWATYSMIKRNGFVVVQQPRKLSTFWCFPTSFMSSISSRNCLFSSSLAPSLTESRSLINIIGGLFWLPDT